MTSYEIFWKFRDYLVKWYMKIQILSTSKRLWTHCKMHNFWCLYMQHYNVIVSLYRSLAYTSTQSNKYLNDLNMICRLHTIVYSKCILFWILMHLLQNCLLEIFYALYMKVCWKIEQNLNMIWIWHEFTMNNSGYWYVQKYKIFGPYSSHAVTN